MIWLLLQVTGKWRRSRLVNLPASNYRNYLSMHDHSSFSLGILICALEKGEEVVGRIFFLFVHHKDTVNELMYFNADVQGVLYCRWRERENGGRTKSSSLKKLHCLDN